jgi:hypothetical protein
MRPNMQLSGLEATEKGEARMALLEGTEAGAVGSIIKALGRWRERSPILNPANRRMRCRMYRDVGGA